MSVSPKKYVSKGGRIIRAVKITDKNYLDVFNYILRNADNIVHRDVNDRNVTSVYIAPGGDESNQKLTFHFQGRGIRVAHVGDYVAFELDKVTGKVVDKRAFIVKEEIFIQKGYLFQK